jgi:SAM-dependent methyltransferase
MAGDALPGIASGHPLRLSPEEALADWRALITANREQIERLREDEPRADFYARRAPQFRPGRLESLELAYLRELGSPSERWLDVGAGGGRFAIPLAQRCAGVVAVEPSPAMRETLIAGAAEHGVTNIEVHAFTWPPPADAPPIEADLGLVAHVLYDIADLGPFLDALEARVRRRCQVILGNRAPSTAFEPDWTELWGEPHHRLPALPEFLGVLAATGRRFDVRTFPAARESTPMPLDDAHAAARRLFWVTEGSARDARLRDLLQRHHDAGDGQVLLPQRIDYTAVVSWEPTAR